MTMSVQTPVYRNAIYLIQHESQMDSDRFGSLNDIRMPGIAMDTAIDAVSVQWPSIGLHLIAILPNVKTSAAA